MDDDEDEIIFEVSIDWYIKWLVMLYIKKTMNWKHLHVYYEDITISLYSSLKIKVVIHDLMRMNIK